MMLRADAEQRIAEGLEGELKPNTMTKVWAGWMGLCCQDPCPIAEILSDPRLIP